MIYIVFIVNINILELMTKYKYSFSLKPIAKNTIEATKYMIIKNEFINKNNLSLLYKPKVLQIRLVNNI